MVNINKVIAPIGILGFLVFLLLTFCIRFENKTVLNGVILTEYPSKVTLASVTHGEFQKNFGKWMTDNFYGHTVVVKCHNQMEYSIFHDGIGDWLVGRDGYLYSKSQTQMYTGGGMEMRRKLMMRMLEKFSDYKHNYNREEKISSI